MAENKSTTLRNAILNHVLRGAVGGTAFAQPSAAYLALYATDPGVADAGAEISGGGYTRTPITFTTPVNGRTVNAAAVRFPTTTGAWSAPAAYFGIRSAATGGTLLYRGVLSAAIRVSDAGQIVELQPGDIIVEEY